MRGTMMDFPLTLPTILERAGRYFPRVEIVSRKPDRSIARTNYGAFYDRARRLAAALTRLGLKPGDRVASMMWNHSGHHEVFFGVPCAGGILHTLNLRLSPPEIAGIARHASDRFRRSCGSSWTSAPCAVRTRCVYWTSISRPRPVTQRCYCRGTFPSRA